MYNLFESWNFAHSLFQLSILFLVKAFPNWGDIASSTGLDLSIPSIENLRHIQSQDDAIEKLHPQYCSLQVFLETLNVSRDVAWEFLKYFSGHGEVESIGQIEGVTEEVLKRFNRYFVKLKVLKPPPNKLFPVHIEPPHSSESEY